MSDYKVTDTQLASIANAIRAKTGKSAQIEFPTEFVSEIGSISGGGGSTNILSGTDIPTAAQGGNGDIYLRYTDYTSELPDGYTRIEYIQSSGNQYINTGYIPKTTSTYIVDGLLSSLGAGLQTFFGSSNGSQWLTMQCPNDQQYVFRGWWGSSQYTPNYINLRDQRIVAELSAGTVSVKYAGGEVVGTYTWTPSTSLPGNPVYIFAVGGANGIYGSGWNATGNMYAFIIKEANTIVMSFIPCIRDSDNAVGMYDIVGDTFYPSVGSDSFLAGGEMTDNIINSAYLKVSGAWQKLIGANINDVGGISN